MGIDYDGGMLVGCDGDDFEITDSVVKYLNDLCNTEPLPDLGCKYAVLGALGLSKYDGAFDSGFEWCNIGFEVPNIPIGEVGFEGWLIDVKEKAAKFESMTGIPATLIGCQNIW